jgi:hypothetical protein
MPLKFQSTQPIQALQGAFNPDRFNQLHSEFGSGGNVTGDTGLLPNDMQGYMDRLNRQREYQSMLKGLQGAQG